MIDDDRLRFQLYDITMREGAPPSIARLAEVLIAADSDVIESLGRLAAKRMIVLQENGEILMAGPFSAVPTSFQVTLDGLSTFGNCIWDAFGIAATMRQDARIDTSCGDCGSAATLLVHNGEADGEGFMHFALPPRQWWDDVVFT